MPTPPRPGPGIARVAYSGAYNGTVWAHVQHVRVNPQSNLTQTIADELAIGMHNAFGGAWAPHLSLQWSLQETNIVLFTDVGTVLEAVTSSVTSGQDSGVTMSGGTALVVSWKTSAYYRGGHPRTYLTGIVQDRLANSKSWTAQTITDFDAGALAYRNAINQIGLAGSHSVTFGLLRTKSQGVDLEPPLFYPIIGHAVHGRVDSQRRRLGRETVT